jgi:hypothetical protein
MEAMNISFGFATSVGSYFAMFLLSGLEDHPYAFFVTSAIIILISLTIFTVCIVKFKEIKNSGLKLIS